MYMVVRQVLSHVFSYLPHKQIFDIDKHGGSRREENPYTSDPDSFPYILHTKNSSMRTLG